MGEAARFEQLKQELETWAEIMALCEQGLAVDATDFKLLFKKKEAQKQIGALQKELATVQVADLVDLKGALARHLPKLDYVEQRIAFDAVAQSRSIAFALLEGAPGDGQTMLLNGLLAFAELPAAARRQTLKLGALTEQNIWQEAGRAFGLKTDGLRPRDVSKLLAARQLTAYDLVLRLCDAEEAVDEVFEAIVNVICGELDWLADQGAKGRFWVFAINKKRPDRCLAPLCAPGRSAAVLPVIEPLRNDLLKDWFSHQKDHFPPPLKALNQHFDAFLPAGKTAPMAVVAEKICRCCGAMDAYDELFIQELF